MDNRVFRMADAVRLLKSISKSNISQIALHCGRAIEEFLEPSAIYIRIELPGLPQQEFAIGRQKFLKVLLDLEILSAPVREKLSNFPLESIEISLDQGYIACLSYLYFQGKPIGLISSVNSENTPADFSPADWISVCSPQVLQRINYFLSPEGPQRLKTIGHKLLRELSEFSVQGVALKSSDQEDDWYSIYNADSEQQTYQLENNMDLQAAVNNSELKDDPVLQIFWPKSNLHAAFVINSEPDLQIVIGVPESKYIDKKIKDKVRDLLNKYLQTDKSQIVESFESLKNNFNKIIKSERAAAITETAVTINHEINNPLTAILGNTQLLLMNRDKFSDEVINKLEAVERSALKIKETTGKLMSIIEPVTTPYASGLHMIDIEKSGKKGDKKES